MTKGTQVSKEEFIERFYNEVETEYELLSDYKNSRIKITVKHNTCGKIWDIYPFNFLGNRNRCPICSNKERTNKRRMSHDKFIKDVSDLVDNEYSIIGQCVLSSQKVEIRHNVCGNIYKVTPNKFKSGRRCPKCSRSNPENNIESVLLRLEITYIREAKFKDCLDKRELPFDFYLPDYNLCIEYDGELHYDDKFNDSDGFNKLKKHDKIKTKYCKSNHIKLIRIPYWESKNIETILTETLT